jgi:hypothetical protein
MASTKRRYSKEEFARRGDQIYETQVRSNLKTEDEGKFAAVDIDSGAYEIDMNELTVCDMLTRIPRLKSGWFGSARYGHRFGGRDRRTAS